MRPIARACAAAWLLICAPATGQTAPVDVAPYRQGFENTCRVNHYRAFCRCMTDAVVQMADIAYRAPEIRRRIGLFPGLAAFALDYAREIGSATDNGISASRLGDAAAYLGKKHAYRGKQEALNFVTALLWEQASKICNRS